MAIFLSMELFLQITATPKTYNLHLLQYENLLIH